MSCAKVEVWAKDSRSSCLMVWMVDDKAGCDKSFQLKENGYLEMGVVCKMLFVLMPLFVEKSV